MRLALYDVQRMTRWMREHEYQAVDVNPTNILTVYYYKSLEGFEKNKDGRHVWRATRDALSALESMMVQYGYAEVELDQDTGSALFFSAHRRLLPEEKGLYIQR